MTLRIPADATESLIRIAEPYAWSFERWWNAEKPGGILATTRITAE
jgi:hypothetical protein